MEAQVAGFRRCVDDGSQGPAGGGFPHHDALIAGAAEGGHAGAVRREGGPADGIEVPLVGVEELAFHRPLLDELVCADRDQAASVRREGQAENRRGVGGDGALFLARSRVQQTHLAANGDGQHVVSRPCQVTHLARERQWLAIFGLLAAVPQVDRAALLARLAYHDGQQSLGTKGCGNRLLERQRHLVFSRRVAQMDLVPGNDGQAGAAAIKGEVTDRPGNRGHGRLDDKIGEGHQFQHAVFAEGGQRFAVR